MDHVIDAITEIFTWVGLGAGVLLGVVALILRLADGTWLPVQVVLEPDDAGTIGRWFGDDGVVHQVRLTREQQEAVAGKGIADAFARRGGRNRMRLTKGSPAVRAVALLAAGLLALGLVALILSWILLFARG